MKRKNLSCIFSAYNRARKSANNGVIDIHRLNRALGIVLSKNPRPYNTTMEYCDCNDSMQRPVICKHRLAKMLEFRAEQIARQSMLDALIYMGEIQQ